jgi:signal transduction histidine kinase/PAS domain-containing protein
VQASSDDQRDLDLDHDSLLAAWSRAMADRQETGIAEPNGTGFVAALVGWLSGQKGLPSESPSFEPMVRELAHARLAEGVSLDTLVAECSLLRECVLGLWTTGGRQPSPRAMPGLIAVYRWIDRAIATAVAVYSDARERCLTAIERVSVASTRSASVEELLQRILDAFEEVAPRVDAAAIALREGDHLRIHAASGVAEHLEGRALQVNEAFTGRIVAERRPLVVHTLDADPSTLPPGLTRSGLRMIYGVPMIEADDVLGVALMGSCTAFEFAQNDRLVFDVIARQATGAIRYLRIRESLARETARTEAILASIPAGVIVVEAPSGRMVLHNHQAEIIWRRTFREPMFIEERDAWVGYTREGRRVEPEAWALSRAFRRGETIINQEVDILRGDGTRGTILNSAAPILAEGGTNVIGGVATFSDISNKRKTENELQSALANAQRTETFQRILAEAGNELAESLDKESVLDTIVSLAVPKLADYCGLFVADQDRQFAIRHFSAVDPAKARRLLEYRERRDPANPMVPSLRPRTVRDVFDKQATKVFDHVPDETLVDLAIGDDGLLSLLRSLDVSSAVLVPMIARGRTLGVAAFARTSSSRQLLPQDIDLAEALTRCSAVALDNHLLYTAAQESARQREEILAVVSHDLRTVLGAVQLNAELLATKALPDPGRARVDRIHYAVRRMERIIRDLMDSTAIAKGTLFVEKKLADVPSIVRSTVEVFEDAARRQGIALVTEVDDTLLPLCCDANRVGQALENLISNALKASGADGSICVRARRSGGEVVFSVADTGLGVPAEELAHLFKKYFRGRGPSGHGLGLGLSIAKSIVSSHGGQIWVESAPGKGSVFSFTIPFHSANATAP